MIKNILLLFFLLTLTACYPIHKTIRPELHIIVTDQNGKSVDQAKVVLMTNGQRMYLQNTIASLLIMAMPILPGFQNGKLNL